MPRILQPTLVVGAGYGSTSRQRLDGAKVALDRHAVPQAEVRRLKISSIRKDGETQHRAAIDPRVVAEYAELMREGVVFPPIAVWRDGKYYWLSDGFQRLAAAESAGLTRIVAEIRPGTLTDARWHSYAANAVHGFRLTVAERQRVLHLALEHPNAVKISDVQLAEHLHLPRTTLRRWRQELSWPNGQDSVITVSRGDTTYTLTTSNIGKTGGAGPAKPRRDLRAELAQMKENASEPARALLNVIEHWALGLTPPARCLNVIEDFLRGVSVKSIAAGSPKSARMASEDRARLIRDFVGAVQP